MYREIRKIREVFTGRSKRSTRNQISQIEESTRN
jgi:hypothetical protein